MHGRSNPALIRNAGEKAVRRDVLKQAGSGLVKGADDADKAKWFLLSDVDPSKIFEDHNGIIQKGVGAVR